jgi:hypothetical protein
VVGGAAASAPVRTSSSSVVICCSLRDYAYNELRYSVLAAVHPQEAEQLLRKAQAGVEPKYRQCEALSRT